MDINTFQKKIGYFFKDSQLIKMAFTHSSYAYENGIDSYERLEFLGDAIVDFLVGEYLFRNYPDIDEGNMSRIRASLVCEKALAELALGLSINECILLGNGADHAGDSMRPSILADVFEAHIAAMYIDAGFENTRDYLLSIYGNQIDELVSSGKFVDYKTALQEKLQKNGACTIEYKLVSADGPVHDCLFTIEVVFDGKVIGKGSAKSKKDAQQYAAADAIKNFG